MKNIQILALLFLFPTAINAQANLEEAKRQVEIGKQLLNSGNSVEASHAFKNAVLSSKQKKYRQGSPEIYVLIGDIYLSNSHKNIKRALLFYETAYSIEPNEILWKKFYDPIFDGIKKEMREQTGCEGGLNEALFDK